MPKLKEYGEYSMCEFIKINVKDDVVVLLEDSKMGDTIKVDDKEIQILQDTPKGHKIAIKNIDRDNEVLEYKFESKKLENTVKENDIYFKGYVRENGDIGIRNEIWIVNTVGCINKTCAILAREGNKLINDKIDGVHHFEHPHGCSQLGDDLKILSGLVNHPNAAGVLVVGLGCENNTLESFKTVLEPINHNRVKFLNIQDVEDEIEEGKKLIKELVDYSSKFEREDVHISKLKIGLKCGGSDAFSGITANPLLGRVSDNLVSLGATSIQTEVPEMFGAETILFERSLTEDVFNNSVDLINDFKKYFIRYDQVIYENPSPGNKKGGITTLEEKSLGCVQKGGNAIVTDVLKYGDRSTKNGLNLISGPGNDQIAVTVLAASGAHMVLFTTGRGTPFGGVVPTLKISTNSDLYNNKKHWIDFNAGQILENKDIRKVDEEFFDLIVNTASGEYMAHNEVNGYKEIAILKDGVTL